MCRFNISEIPDKNSLAEVLKNTSIEVPRRTEGRKTEHTEKWTICHLLSTLNRDNALAFPVSVQHVDKPDFILVLDTYKVGVEVTESIPVDYARCRAMAERENPDAEIDMSLFKWGSPRKTTEELREIISCSELAGDGWNGVSPEICEIEWAYHIHDAVSTKLKKLNNAGYEELPEYWVSIYDNLPLPNVHATRATKILLSTFSKQWTGIRTFSRILIERGPIIVDIQGNSFKNYKVEDLWP